MNIYVVNILLTLLWGFMLLLIKPTPNKRKAFVGLTAAQWILISGLRGMSVSPDMFSYKLRYNVTTHMSWKQVFRTFYDVYVNEEGKDPGYTLFEKITQVFVTNYQAYLFIVAVIFFVCLAVWIYRNSRLPCFSYLIFSAFLFRFYAITGTRQTIATALVVLVGTELIKRRQFWKFLLICAIAFTIHKSSMVFLPFYFISQKEITVKYSAAIFGAFPILFVLRNQYIEVLNYISGYDYDALESSGAYSFTFIYMAVCVISIILIKFIKANCENYKIYYNALFMGMLFLPAVFVNPALMRVVQYFTLYIMLMIPEIVCSIEKKYRSMAYTAMTLVLLIASNLFNSSYQFFWQ